MATARRFQMRMRPRVSGLGDVSLGSLADAAKPFTPPALIFPVDPPDQRRPPWKKIDGVPDGVGTAAARRPPAPADASPPTSPYLIAGIAAGAVLAVYTVVRYVL